MQETKNAALFVFVLNMETSKPSWIKEKRKIQINCTFDTTVDSSPHKCAKQSSGTLFSVVAMEMVKGCLRYKTIFCDKVAFDV